MTKPLSSLLATGFGIGHLPVAPGTWGSLMALLPAWGLWCLGGQAALALTSVLLFFPGVWAAHRHAQKTKDPDPSEVVIDEIVGQWIALAFLPLTPVICLCGFLLFRLFDILKPWPVALLEKRFRGGWGVMLDDVMAGVYAGSVLWLGAGLFEELANRL